MATGKKNRTGVLKRALMDATCAATVTATKPCGKIKTKLQGKQIRNKSALDKTLTGHTEIQEMKEKDSAD